jgi:hypothetical protein
MPGEHHQAGQIENHMKEYITSPPHAAPPSPLWRWWCDHKQWLNEVCLAAGNGDVALACAFRRLLREVARGDTRIDDPRLRAVVGAMIRDGLVELVREHRAWARAKGGA